MPNIKYVIWFKFPLLTWIAVYLQDATKNLIEADHNASENSTKPENVIMTEKNNTKHHTMKDHSWVRLTQPVGQHINNNESDYLTLKGPPNILVSSFPRNEKDCVFQSFTS